MLSLPTVDRPVLGSRYELGAAVGSGGFGTVFRAHDRQTGLDVAVKFVPEGPSSTALAARLVAEAASLRKVRSRHVARFVDFGEDAAGVWLVTELVVGAPLAPQGIGRALYPHEILRVARGLLEGLAAVHAAGLVHGDVKPANVLVPFGKDMLDLPKLIDFGLATSLAPAATVPPFALRAPSSLHPDEAPPSAVSAFRPEAGTSAFRSPLTPRAGTELPPVAPLAPRAEGEVVLGSPRYMAPELLGARAEARHVPDVRSDLYAVGLVLFELLDDGDLFGGIDLRERLQNRLACEPVLEGRVPPPLAGILARLLARAPADRFPSAKAAYEAVTDLDTAPVALNLDEAGPISLSPEALSSRTPSFGVGLPLSPSSSLRPSAGAAAPSGAPSGAPASHRSSIPKAPRLSRLPAEPASALRETLRHLDLPMLDALARRERGSSVGRVARALSLALRLELDAAALVLEPLVAQDPLAQAIGAALIAPVAKRATRARVDAADPAWVDVLDPELGAMLGALAVALADESAPRGGSDAVPRSTGSSRGALVLRRVLEAPRAAELGPGTRATLRAADAAVRLRAGTIDRRTAFETIASLDGDPLPGVFDQVVRGLLVGSVVAGLDDGRALDAFGAAERAAAQTGATLLDARVLAARGIFLVERQDRDGAGLATLERATTLLAPGEAPMIEHGAEHHRGIALLLAGRYGEATERFAAARAAAHLEGAEGAEVVSAALEVATHLALAGRPPPSSRGESRDPSDALRQVRLGTARGNAPALAWLVRALEASANGDLAEAEDAVSEAASRIRGIEGEAPTAHVVVETLALLFDAARGALPDLLAATEGLERFAADQHFGAFYWFDLVRATLERGLGPAAARPMLDTLSRVALFVGAGTFARERRTTAPPAAAR